MSRFSIERRHGRSGVRFGAILTALAALASACVGGGGAPYLVEGCTPRPDPDRSVARVWNETLLDGIRRDFPAPTVHARNLFHVSAAMWDAWAAYDPVAAGYFVDEDHEGDEADREAAISFAAYRILGHRYELAIGGIDTLIELDEAMASYCYDVDYIETEEDEPAALGNRIAEAVIEFGKTDGSLEENLYDDPDYRSVNPPLVVAQPGTAMADPNRWQPLSLEEQVAQNELPLPGQIQVYIGPQWGRVSGFSLDPSPEGLPLDPGPPPHLGDPDTDAAFKQGAVEVIRYSSLLDPDQSTLVDIGPGSMGDNPLGTNDGDGLERNAATGEPYAANEVLHADYGRVIAEYWADGPESETPPGHWNTLANSVADAPGSERLLGGEGQELGALEWDVKLYFALNGALHDSAVAAWGAKAYYDYARPISMIRYMGGLGQSSDPEGPSYHEDGLPLVDGLIEIVTPESSAPGEPHEHLADHIGDAAIRAWAGNPEDPTNDVSGVEWIRAVEWVPYQRPTFVTPAFAGYVSGHSTFSRAGAEVLAAATGSPFFPGGLAEWTVPAGELLHEEGPTTAVTLQWATYADAADQAGISRLYGGIHVPADDVQGRIMGATIGEQAWELARRYFDGSIDR